MACTNNTKRVVSIAHGADAFDQPAGGNITETVVFGEHRPGNRKAACIYLASYGARAVAKWHGLQTPVVRGTKADLVFTIEQIDGTASSTVTISDVRAGGCSIDFDQEVHVQSQEFVHDSEDSDDLAPIAISL